MRKAEMIHFETLRKLNFYGLSLIHFGAKIKTFSIPEATLIWLYKNILKIMITR